MSRARACGVAIVLAVLPASGRARAEGLAVAATTEGFTGLLGSPNAEVADEGTFHFLYASHRVPTALGGVADTFLLTLAPVPFGEVTARASGEHFTVGGNDLAAGFKLQLPLRRLHRLLPNVAGGMTDVGGQNALFRRRYGVLSAELGPVRASAGYADRGGKDGSLFGGIEVGVARWLQLVGEHDGEEASFGARVLLSGRLASLPMRAGTTLRVRPELEGRRLDLSFHVQAPLGSVSDAGRQWAEAEGLAGVVAAPADPRQDAPAAAPEAAARRILERLAAIGFENLRVGLLHGGRTVVVTYENSRFMQSELDGLGVVLGVVAAEAPAEVARVVAWLRRFDQPILEVQSPVAPLRDLYARDPARSAAGGARLIEALEVWECLSDLGEVDWIGPRRTRPAALRPRLILQPGVRTFVATELGLIDYVLAIRPELQLPLPWAGGALSVIGELPLAWSDAVDRGLFFLSEPRTDAHLRHALLYQALHLGFPGSLLLGAGMVRDGVYGGVAEAIFSPHDLVRFRSQAALTTDRHRSDNLRDSELAALRVRIPPLAAFVEASGGKFLEGGRGFRVEAGRFFGDTRVSFHYTDTSFKMAGIEVSVPLTPRRDMRVEGFQIRGASRWSYSQSTVVGEAMNVIRQANGQRPETEHNLERVFYDGDRLYEGYVRDHLGRLREAYLLFGRD